jgi:ABC-type enterochelin transport system ATPase subunit
MFTTKDYLNDLRVKTVINPVLVEELKAVLIGEPTNNLDAKQTLRLINVGLLAKKDLEYFVSSAVALEEIATAQMEGCNG